MPLGPSAHLLRTLASVPVSSRILVLGVDEGRHLEPLLQLGFDMHAADADEAAVQEARQRFADALGADEVRQRIIHARPQALGHPDEYFDWVILYRTFGQDETSVEDMLEAMAETRRVLTAGGWAYVALETGAEGQDADDEHVLGFYGLMQRAELELAEKAEVFEEDGRRIVRGIFRRVNAHTPY